MPWQARSAWWRRTGELQVFLEPIEPSKETCPDDKRKKVAEAIEAYVKLDGGASQAPTTTGSTAKGGQQPTAVAAPTKDQKKK